MKIKSHHNRRQRKKLRIGEFQELGFSVSAKLKKPLSAEERDAWIDEFIDTAVEANGLLFAGGCNASFWGFIMSAENYTSVTEEQRAKVSAWLTARSELTELDVSALHDAYYGQEKVAV